MGLVRLVTLNIFLNTQNTVMAFFRQFIAPLLVVLVFVVALVAVSARIFLPEDMAAPAPITDVDATVVSDVGQMF